jgi:hypothetical protein
MQFPYNLIEDLQETLPSAMDFKDYYISKEVTYEGERFRINFYKAKLNESSPYFWICNPFNAVPILST